MSGFHGPCHLCEVLVARHQRFSDEEGFPGDFVDCETCGLYVMSDSAKEELQRRPAAAPVLSGWAKTYSRTLDVPFRIGRSTVVSAATI